MATPPDFTVGQVLTAAQMNAVGLWRITTCTASSAGGTAATASNGVITVGSGNTSVTVNNAFSADYDAYKIIWTNGNASAAGELGLQLGSSTANYFGFLQYGSYTAATLFGVNDNAQSRFRYVGGFDGFYCSLNVDIFGPFLSRVTTISAQGNYGAFSFGTYSGRHADTNSYSSFTLIPGTGTLSGGQICVYGYRK